MNLSQDNQEINQKVEPLFQDIRTQLGEKSSIERNAREVIEQIFSQELQDAVRATRLKHLIKNALFMVFSFVVGLCLAFIPSMYLSQKHLAPYHFVPNALITDKAPEKMEWIHTPERLKIVQMADILNKRDLKLDSYIMVNPKEGLIVVLGTTNQGSTFKPIKPEPTSIISGQYVFTPNVLRYRKPMLVQIMNSQTIVERAQTYPSLKNDISLKIGAAVAPTDDGNYYAIPKEKVETAFVVKDLSELVK